MTVTASASLESKPTDAAVRATPVANQSALHPLHATSLADPQPLAHAGFAVDLASAPSAHTSHGRISNQAVLRLARAQSEQLGPRGGSQAEEGAALTQQAPIRKPSSIQRKCSCGGACPSCTMEDEYPVIQHKLEINTPGDAREMEADRIADSVIAGGETSGQREFQTLGTAPPAPPLVTSIRLKPVSASGSSRNNQAFRPEEAIEDRIVASRRTGSPLGGATLRFMEDRFGTDFSDVRIHSDPASHSLAQSLHAYAFTTGRDIFFANGQYRPGTRNGDHLLAHELSHVIQQTGAVQRTSVTRVQRLGEWAHRGIQDRLIEENKDRLMCEVHIPGAVAPDTDDSPVIDLDKLNNRGFSDLYLSDSNIVSGVRAISPSHPGPDALGSPPLRYVQVGTTGKRKILGAAPTFSPKILSRPRKVGQSYQWNDNPGFPKAFVIGELKPQYATEFPQQAASGMLQVNKYTEGFQAFATRLVQDSNGAVKTVPTGVPMKFTGPAKESIKIPDELDLSKRRKQPATLNRKKALFHPELNKRVWVVGDTSEPGVLRYLLLSDPNARPPGYGMDLETRSKLIDDYVKSHPQKFQKPSNSLDKKSKPGSPSQNALQIQRKVDCSAPGDLSGGWKSEWCAFEQFRSDWAGTPATPGSASEFLKKEAVGRQHEIDVEKHFNLYVEQVPDEEKKLKRVAFWAGPFGKPFGLLRFRFAALFERVGALFKKIKEKFGSFYHGASANVQHATGWEKAAFEVIATAFVTILKTLASEAYRDAVDCVWGVVSNIEHHYFDEVTEEIAQALEPILAKVEILKQQLEEKYEPVISFVTKLLAAIDNVRSLVGMLKDIEWGLRILIEAISCASPPALGCLWGLVAQVGFDLAAAKAIATDLFREKIAEPAARKLLDETGAGDKIRNFVSSIVVGLGLGQYLKDVEPCMPKQRYGGPRLSRDISFDNNAPELRKARAQLENENAPQAMYDDLRKVLTSDGKPATAQEIKRLVDALKTANLKPEDLRKLLERRSKDAKTDITDAILRVGQAAAPTSPQSPNQGGAARSGPLAVPTSVVYGALKDADWKKVPPGGAYIDTRHSPARLLAKTTDGVRIGALVIVKLESVKGRQVNRVTEAGEVLLMDDTSRTAFEMRGEASTMKAFVFFEGHRGDVIDPSGEMFVEFGVPK